MSRNFVMCSAKNYRVIHHGEKIKYPSSKSLFFRKIQSDRKIKEDSCTMRHFFPRIKSGTLPPPRTWPSINSSRAMGVLFYFFPRLFLEVRGFFMTTHVWHRFVSLGFQLSTFVDLWLLVLATRGNFNALNWAID